jgi:hypothetical protein
MRATWPSEGWYYRQDGQPVGPVSAWQLRELLRGGRLGPRQAVWQQGGRGLLFVHAAAAASGTPGEALARQSAG